MMGKYTRKAKMSADVPLTDVSQSYLGVRTRAKALALQSSDLDVSYLQLRSRRLQKTMHPKQIQQDLAIEASCGENNFDFQVTERGTRESTPCSSTSPTITTTPGSTSKQASSRTSSQWVQDALVINGHELEEFFAREEQEMQRRFIDKYNFDIVKDSPLSGRYEWVAVRP